MKGSFVYILLFLITIPKSAFGQAIQNDSLSSLHITKFYTLTGTNRQDSVWNIHKEIKLPAQPIFLTVTVQDEQDKKPDLICIVYETIKIYDTLRIENGHIANFFNLTGGDYELIFINLNNKAQTKINFSIEPDFWEAWWFGPFILLTLSVVIGTIFYFIFLIRTRARLHLQFVKYELEIKALRAQMNPHFIFNCLNTIDAYILRKRFVEASDCLQKFSKLIRQILENSEYQTISIEKELTTLNLYIELEQERFGNMFDYHIQADPELSEEQYQIPPLLLQPFVENAILHGIRHLRGKRGLLSIVLAKTFVNEKESLLCKITDNGIGRKASAQLHEQHKDRHKSMGMSVTFERIMAHQAHYGAQMKTQIEDLNGVNTGTKVQIWLPLLTS